MSKAVIVESYGGPEVLKVVDQDVPAPGPGEIQIRHTAIGLNFIDVYMRTGLYALPSLPGCLGMEGAGVVEALGDGVTELKVGERVAYASKPPGSYAELRNIDATRVAKLPDTIADETAGAMMLQGLTAQYLLHQAYPVQSGDTIVIHAAAGGVGLIVCQWAKLLGATVIGTVGSPEKAELARQHGCDHPILYRDTNFKDAVLELTNGKGAHVVYDSIGQDTFMDSLGALRKHGTMILFGSSSGPVQPFDPALLGKMGSLYLSRPTLFDFIEEPAKMRAMAQDLFDVVSNGDVRIEVNQTYPLDNIAQAHRDLEARRTTGSSILIP